MQTNQENAQKIFNHVFGVFKISRIMFFIPIVVFIIIIATAIILTSNNKPSYDDNNDFGEIFEDITGEKEGQEIVVEGLDVFAETEEYKVKVTKYEKEEDMFNRLDDDYEYVKFHFVVENLKDSRLTKEDVNCVVDGIAQNNYYSSGYSDLPMFINKGLTVKGTATFEVPKNANSYEIKYGDYVTIKISK